MHSETQSIDQAKRSFIETHRRAQILECAVEAIADLGFAKASLAQIARRANVSPGVILYHFAGKEDLIRHVVAHVFAAGERFIRARVDQSSARAALCSFIAASVAFVAANPKNALAVMNIMRSSRSESDASRYDPAVVQPRQAGLVAILERGQRTAEFRPFAVRVMAATIIEALDAIPAELAAEPALDLDTYASELVELFDRATRNDRVACQSLLAPPAKKEPKIQ